MSVQISCPVFRCPKTSISQCTGYRRACEHFYCHIHSKGTLCERCVKLKQEDLKSSYRQMLKSLERKAHTASLTIGVVVLFLISLLLLVWAIYYGFLQKNNQINILIFVLSLGGGMLGIVGSLFWYVIKAREYMRAESVELDLTYPGFYDYYEQWKAKVEEITNYSTYYGGDA